VKRAVVLVFTIFATAPFQKSLWHAMFLMKLPISLAKKEAALFPH